MTTIFIFIALLSALNLVTSLKVTLPVSGNTWDLTQLDSYSIFWESHSADPSHVHVSLHDGAGKVVESFESVKSSSGAFLISGLYRVPSGSNYQVVLSDASKPTRKILARSGKFSIRQVAGGSSSGIADDPTSAVSSLVASTGLPPALTSPSTTQSSSDSSSPTPTTTPSTSSIGASAGQSTSGQMTSASTSTSSTPFPKFKIPNQGLSTGAKAGIGVGVAIVVLLIIGAAILLWRKRRHARNVHQDDHVGADMREHHGKPELAGSQSYEHSRGAPLVGAEKSELDVKYSSAGSPMGQMATQAVSNDPPPIAELPPQRNPAREGTGIIPPKPLPNHTGYETVTRDRNLVELNAPTSEYQSPHPAFAELPTTVSRNASRTDHSTATPTSNKHAPPAAMSIATSSTSATAAGGRTTSSQTPSQQRTTTTNSDLDSSSTANNDNSTYIYDSNNADANANANANTNETNNDDEEEEMSALRQRERELADYISAAENLVRLKSERRELQERIRRKAAVEGRP